MNAGRWLVSLLLSVVAGAGWWFVADRWDSAFDSPVTAVAFWGTVPVIAALCAAPRMRPAAYLASGVPGVVILALVVAYAFPEPYEPIFARSFVAVLNGFFLLIALALGALPLILWGKLAARSRSIG